MREALGFLTILGGPRAPNPRALRWFPVVGVMVGAAVGSVWWAGGEVLPAFVAAALAVAADAAITGMLHFDGLADTADGLLPHATRERRLKIMRTPEVGAFALVVVVFVIVLRVAALSDRLPDIALVAAIWCASRTVVAVAPAWLTYVREEGIASTFVTTKTAVWPALALGPAAGIAIAAIGMPGLAAIGGTALGAMAVLAFARARIGGFTGDVLGAAIVIGETVGLVIAAARW